MVERITVGEFARLTHLTVKALHYYHHVGVLEPASVDPVTGYRLYTTGQLSDAYLIRRLRDVGMPVPQVKAVLAAPDVATRDAEIATHLQRLREELVQVATAVSSLEALLSPAWAPDPIRFWDAPEQVCVSRHATLSRNDIVAWFDQTYPLLHAAAGRLDVPVTGPGGALYGASWFEEGSGTVTAYVPIAPTAVSPPGDLGLTTLPAGPHAVLHHAGAYPDLDRTYGSLGRQVLERGIGEAGSIRELYLVSPSDTPDPAQFRTDVCWPVHSSKEL